MLQKVTRLDSVPTAEETVLTTEVPTKESRLYTLLTIFHISPHVFCVHIGGHWKRLSEALQMLFVKSVHVTMYELKVYQ